MLERRNRNTTFAFVTVAVILFYVYLRLGGFKDSPKKISSQGFDPRNNGNYAARDAANLCATKTTIRTSPESDKTLLEICTEVPFNFDENCLVYIFGMSESFSVVNEFLSLYKCKIRLFDHRLKGGASSYPSTTIIKRGLSGVNQNNQKQMTFGDLRDALDESMTTIHLVVIQSTYAKLDVMRTIFANDGLFKVKQIFIILPNGNQEQGLREAISAGMTEAKFTKISENQSDGCSAKSVVCNTMGFLNSRYRDSANGLAKEELTLIPLPNLSALGESELEEQFTRFVKRKHYECKNYTRVGRSDDGGWNICLDTPFKMKSPCLVYSFGIRKEWSFDDGLAKAYGCDVRSFDPSMGVPTHNRSSHVSFYDEGIAGFNGYDPKRKWNVKTLGGFIKALGDTQKTIDYLKIDVDYSEWDSFPAMLKEGVLKNVKQFSFEFHTKEMHKHRTKINKYDSTADDFRMYWATLNEIEVQGFRKWSVHSNGWGMYDSQFSKKRRTCCFEVYYVNSNFPKN